MITGFKLLLAQNQRERYRKLLVLFNRIHKQSIEYEDHNVFTLNFYPTCKNFLNQFQKTGKTAIGRILPIAVNKFYLLSN
jgi:hypothetical protein